MFTVDHTGLISHEACAKGHPPLPAPSVDDSASKDSWTSRLPVRWNPSTCSLPHLFIVKNGRGISEEGPSS